MSEKRNTHATNVSVCKTRRDAEKCEFNRNRTLGEDNRGEKYDIGNTFKMMLHQFYRTNKLKLKSVEKQWSDN